MRKKHRGIGFEDSNLHVHLYVANYSILALSTYFQRFKLSLRIAYEFNFINSQLILYTNIYDFCAYLFDVKDFILSRKRITAIKIQDFFLTRFDITTDW